MTQEEENIKRLKKGSFNPFKGSRLERKEKKLLSVKEATTDLGSAEKVNRW